MGAVGYGHFAPLGIAPGPVVGSDHQHPCQLSMGAGQGGQAYTVQTGYLPKESL